MKISVIVHPNSKNPRIEKDLINSWHVYVNQPPLEGKANKAVIGALAEHFQTKKGNIILLKGAKSKTSFLKLSKLNLQKE